MNEVQQYTYFMKKINHGRTNSAIRARALPIEKGVRL